jgi:hypothetical protein
MAAVTRTVTPTWFRSHVLPAYGDRTWADCEAALLADPLERRRIEELKAELIHRGFDLPVLVGRDHGWSRPQVQDGVHRSIAAMELGVPIPIRYGYPDHTDADYPDLSDLYAVTSAGSTIDELGVVGLASFRCSAGAWIQCDSASASPQRTAMELYLPHHPHLRRLIAEELQDRLRGAGIDATVTFLERRVND